MLILLQSGTHFKRPAEELSPSEKKQLQNVYSRDQHCGFLKEIMQSKTFLEAVSTERWD